MVAFHLAQEHVAEEWSTGQDRDPEATLSRQVEGHMEGTKDQWFMYDDGFASVRITTSGHGLI